jgi:hypothetical protein
MYLLRSQLQHAQPSADDLVAVSTVLARTAARQCGVLTRNQLRAYGVADSQVRAAVAAQRWRSIGRHVVVLHNGPLTAAQRHWVAVLLPGKPCALAAASAATAAGLRGFEPERVHVVVRHATHVAAPTWVKLHESRRFSAADIHHIEGLPTTSAARSIVDAATWSPWPRRACVFLCAAVQQRVATATRLETELAMAGPVRHAAIMRVILGDIGGGGHTLAEIDLAAIARRAGLAAPRRQVLRREPNGRVRYVDAEFDLPDGTALVVEIDGAVHLNPEVWSDDMSRQNEIVIGGRPVLRFSSLTVRLDQDRVVDQLARMRVARAAAA